MRKYKRLEWLLKSGEFEGHPAFLECHIDAFLMGALGTWDAKNEAPLRPLGLTARTIRWLAYKCAKTCVEHTFSALVNSLNDNVVQ